MNGINKCMEDMWYTTLKENWKDICVCVCEKNLAMECDREKNATCLTGTKKKHAQKKLPNPPLKNLMVRPQPQDITH